MVRSITATPAGKYESGPAMLHVLTRIFAFCAIVSLGLGAVAQFSNPEPAATEVHNAAALRPPEGARVAIVEWEDLECPDCAHANPILEEAAEKYGIPWVRHDFPLPFHHWSLAAAVDARWFDTQGKKLGDGFRDAVFAAQAGIKGDEELRGFAVKFAREHGLEFPAVVDPEGRLAALVKADTALGQSVGIRHTPTIWVVTDRPDRATSAPFVEVLDRGRLFALIEQAQAGTK